MQVPNAQERQSALLRDAQLAVCILGNESLTDFALVSAEEFEAPRDGLRLVGVVGIVDGAPRSALSEPLDAGTLSALSAACVQYIAQAIERRAGLVSSAAIANA
jgi:hypothetical protein